MQNPEIFLQECLSRPCVTLNSWSTKLGLLTNYYLILKASGTAPNVSNALCLLDENHDAKIWSLTFTVVQFIFVGINTDILISCFQY